MRLTETFDDLFTGDVAREVRRRGDGVIRAARGLPVEAPRAATRSLLRFGLFAGGLAAGIGVGMVARRLTTRVPDAIEPATPDFPVRDGVVDLTAAAEADGIPSPDLGVTDAAPRPGI